MGVRVPRDLAITGTSAAPGDDRGGWAGGGGRTWGLEGRARGFRSQPPEGAEGAKGERAVEGGKGGGTGDSGGPDGGLVANSCQLFKHIPASADITSGIIQIKDIKGR